MSPITQPKRGDKKEAKQLLERIARRLKKPPVCNAMKNDERLNGGFLRRQPKLIDNG